MKYLSLPDDYCTPIEMLMAVAQVIAEETVQPRPEAVLALKQMLRDAAEETNRQTFEVAFNGFLNLAEKASNDEMPSVADCLDSELELEPLVN